MNPIGGQARSTPAGDSAARVKAVVSAYADAWNHHDAAGIASLFTEDADFVNVIGRHSRGHAEVLAEFTMLHRSFMRRSELKILGASVRFLEPAGGCAARPVGTERS